MSRRKGGRVGRKMNEAAGPKVSKHNEQELLPVVQNPGLRRRHGGQILRSGGAFRNAINAHEINQRVATTIKELPSGRTVRVKNATLLLLSTWSRRI